MSDLLKDLQFTCQKLRMTAPDRLELRFHPESRRYPLVSQIEAANVGPLGFPLVRIAEDFHVPIGWVLVVNLERHPKEPDLLMVDITGDWACALRR